MAQFDVYRVRGGVLVLDCQSPLLADLPTRFVVPLRAASDIAITRLNPVFMVEGHEMTMVTPLARSIAKRDVIDMVTSLADQDDVIKSALDMLILGF